MADVVKKPVEEDRSKSGYARIKPEYVLTERERVVLLDHVSEKDKQKLLEEQGQTEGDEQPQKKARLDKVKLKGQNHARPLPYKVKREACICPLLVDVPEGEDFPKCNNERCSYMHEVKEYLAAKPPDIRETCYLYSTFGHCPRGISCRFGSEHLTSEGRNKVNTALKEKHKASTMNQLTKELQQSLRKRTYNFSKSEAILSKMDFKTCGAVTDEDIIRVRKEEKKKIDWTGKLYLSPLTTVGNLPFRRICKELGADITCGEMALASNILQGQQQEWALVKRHESEDLFGVQLCGTNAYTMTRAAQLLEENTKVDFIDINLGCPIDLIYEQGGGSALLRREKALESIVRSMNSVLSLPLTIKTRTGVYANNSVAHNLMPDFTDWGASLITVHGRSREQRYTKSADWAYIEECAQLAYPTPVFGNGDILSWEDYREALDNFPSISGIMIGRGALIKPWIFSEIKDGQARDISSSERLEILRRYVNYGLEHWGSDTKGIENTRWFLLEWLSFLYRYIPLGLLEQPPQRINDRPPYFRGRDDLETLMASRNCSDWIKISEMLLGPVPEKFHFLPKHRANSWS